MSSRPYLRAFAPTALCLQHGSLETAAWLTLLIYSGLFLREALSTLFLRSPLCISVFSNFALCSFMVLNSPYITVCVCLLLNYLPHLDVSSMRTEISSLFITLFTALFLMLSTISSTLYRFINTIE